MNAPHEPLIESEPLSSSLPEKVAGVERLAELGFPVPEYRCSVTAEHFESETPPPEFIPFLKSLRKKARSQTPKFYILVRSAHPEEKEFKGGTFQTGRLHIRKSWSVIDIWAAVRKSRAYLVREASSVKPAAHLLVRNPDYDVDSFDPEDMGVYINDEVPGEMVLVTPKANGGLTLGTLLEVYYPEQKRVPIQVDISSEGVGPSPESTYFTDRYWSGVFELVAEAQQSFDRPQEMEMRVDFENPISPAVFTQTKQEVPREEPSTETDAVESTPQTEKSESEKFHLGLQCGYDRDATNGWLQKQHFSVTIPEGRVKRPLKAQVILLDEFDWFKAHYPDLDDPQLFRQFSSMMPNPFLELFAYLRKCIKQKLPTPELRDKILEQGYADLFREMRDSTLPYVLLVKSLLEGESSHYQNLVRQASVLFAPEELEVGGVAYDHHTALSTGGPQQMVVTHRDLSLFYGPYLASWARGSRDMRQIYGEVQHDEAEQKKRMAFSSLKTGDLIEVLFAPNDSEFGTPDISFYSENMRS